MYNNSILTKNETESNKFAAKTMLFTNVFVVLVYTLTLVRLFVVDIGQMTVAMLISTVFLTLPSVVVLIMKKQDAWVKYLITISAVIMVCSVTSLLQHHTIILFLYPVAISSLYFSRSLSWYTVISSLVLMPLAQIIGFHIGIEDKNSTTLYGVIVFSIIPRAITYLAVSLILVLLSKRTGKLLRNIMGAEEQASMLEKMKAVTSKSLEFSNVLVDSVEQLSQVTENTTKTNEQITASTNKIASGAEEANCFMDEASQAVLEISQNLNRIAADGKKITDISTQVQHMTDENGRIMKDAEDEMNSIAEATKESKEIIERLEMRSSEISKIVEVITGISEQTNMLALNAAIESARAGEQGRGFAVVASQIRALAEQSQNATMEIEAMIQEVMQDTGKAVSAMDRSSLLVDKGVGVIKNAGASFEKVSTAGTQMNIRIKEVSNTTSDVARSSNKIVEIVDNIKAINSNSIGKLKEIASASEALLASMQQVASSVINIEEISKELYTVVKES